MSGKGLQFKCKLKSKKSAAGNQQYAILSYPYKVSCSAKSGAALLHTAFIRAAA